MACQEAKFSPVYHTMQKLLGSGIISQKEQPLGWEVVKVWLDASEYD